MNTPIVAIIGLPNSGKSTFFNKVLGRTTALTYPEAGTTRDRAYGLTVWNGLSFYLVDTAGIAHPGSDLEKNIQKQTQIAKEEADLIILMVDGKTPVANQDLSVANQLSKLKKPTVLAANKIDARNARSVANAFEYAKLGLGEVFPTSSVNGSGIGDLLDAVVVKLKKIMDHGSQLTNQDPRLRIAFIGKPNVGKSSLINALLKEDRMIVHWKAGTTRSSVEIPFAYNGMQFLLIDTAGIKRKWKQDADVETASAFQSLKVLAQTDVSLFVVDASESLTAQDQIISQQILENKKSTIIVLNKSDLLNTEQKNTVLDVLPNYLPQLSWASVVFVSAKTGDNLSFMLKLAWDSEQSQNLKLSQTELDDFLAKILAEHFPGKIDDQRGPKVYSINQIGLKPPTFKVTVNFPAAIAKGWRNYFEKQFRNKFKLVGTPIEIKYVRKQ